MTDYEVTYILRPGLEESEVETRANAIAEIVKSQGGELVGLEKLGRKRLAYEIDDVREGNYVVMQFKSSAEASKELERQLKLHEDVLRALVVRLDKKMIAHMAAVAAATPPPPV
jgi:small subunit ribosomal protein S6